MELRPLFDRIAERLDLIEHRLSAPSDHQRDPSKGRAHKPATPSGPPAPVSRPAPAVALPSQQDLWQEVSRRRKQPNKPPTPIVSPSPGLTVPLTKPTRGQHTEITIQLPPADPSSETTRRDPVVITRQICAGLRSSGSPLVLLSGRWASASQNFVLTFAGMVPFDTIQRDQAMLVQAFPSGQMIPSSGLSKVTFNGVPTIDPETGAIFTAEKLLSEVRRNPICSDLQIILQPRWIRPPELILGPHSSVSFAFLDPDGLLTQGLSRAHLAMFGKEITFKKWLARPPLVQCARCHKLGHQGPRCTLPKEALCCPRCGGNHRAADHPHKCKQADRHAKEGTCDCPIICLNCKELGHSARDVTCAMRASFRSPAHNTTHAAISPPSS